MIITYLYTMKPTGDFNNRWRRVASTIYRKPVDSKIFGAAELDVTRLEAFINTQRRDGIKITLTHLFVMMVARCIKDEVPQLNVFFRRGKIIPRKSIDAMVSVLQADGGMGSVIIEDVDKLSLNSLATILNAKIKASRQGKESKNMQQKNILSYIPWPIRQWFFSLYKTFTIQWGFTLPFTRLKATIFGSFVITNIGSIGLDTGYPALLPSGNMAFVMVLGGVKKKPVVIDDKIAIRRVMSVSVVLDHRLVDASHGGKLLRYIKTCINNPETLLNNSE